MAKSAYEYEILQIAMELHTGLPSANAELSSKTDEGWEVQQVFTNSIANGPVFTFALLRRKREVSTETYTHTGF